MKRYLVPTAVLLLLGTVLGQSSPSTLSKPSGKNLGTVIQAAQENAPSQQNQQMPGMQMPDNPQPQQQQQAPTGHEQMPGMQMPQSAEQQQPESKPGPTYALEQLQQLAVDHNPTLKQAQAEIRAAEARKRQAGLYPNPTVGYIGEQISGGSQRGGEQGAFVQQDIVLGGKLGAARRVAEQERLQADAERGEQLLRVQNGVAIAYYQTLGAQQTVAIREKLLQLAQDAVSTANQLYNIGQADQPDVLQAQVEAGQEEIALESSRQRQQMLWRSLAAVTGQPTLPFGQLAGSLENVPDLDTQRWLENILQNSPAVKISSLSFARAQAELDRAKREPIPDLQIRVGIQQNRELLETTGRPVGLQGARRSGSTNPYIQSEPGKHRSCQGNYRTSGSRTATSSITAARTIFVGFPKLFDCQGSGRPLQNQNDSASRKSVPALSGSIPQYGGGLSASADCAKNSVSAANRLHLLPREPLGKHCHFKRISAERWA
jgi:outer membrane protein, heavy metal efflux system